MNNAVLTEGTLASYLSTVIPEGKRRDCSRETGIPTATLTRKLKGRGAFRVDELEAIAIYLNSRSEYLIAAARQAA